MTYPINPDASSFELPDNTVVKLFLSTYSSRIAFDATCLGVVLFCLLLRLWIRYCILPFRPVTKSYVISDILLVIGTAMCATFVFRDITFTNDYADLDRSDMKGVMEKLGGIKVMKIEDFLSMPVPDMLKLWEKINEKISWGAKLAFTQYIIAVIGECALKISLGVYMTTVTAVMTKRVHCTILCVLVFPLISSIATILYLLLRCRPLSNYWIASTNNCLAIDMEQQTTVILVNSLISDILLLTLSIHLLRRSLPKTSPNRTIHLAGSFFLTLLGVSILATTLFRAIRQYRAGWSVDTILRTISAGDLQAVVDYQTPWAMMDWIIFCCILSMTMSCVVHLIVVLPLGARNWRERRAIKRRRREAAEQTRRELNMSELKNRTSDLMSKARISDGDKDAVVSGRPRVVGHVDKGPGAWVWAWQKKSRSDSPSSSTSSSSSPELNLPDDIKLGVLHGCSEDTEAARIPECGCGSKEWEACCWEGEREKGLEYLEAVEMTQGWSTDDDSSSLPDDDRDNRRYDDEILESLEPPDRNRHLLRTPEAARTRGAGGERSSGGIWGHQRLGSREQRELERRMERLGVLPGVGMGSAPGSRSELVQTPGAAAGLGFGWAGGGSEGTGGVYRESGYGRRRGSQDSGAENMWPGDAKLATLGVLF